VFKTSPTDVLVTVFDKTSLLESLKLARELRDAGLRVEWYPEAARLEKQLKYADSTGVRFAAIVGPDEAAQGIVMVKDLQTRTQQAYPRAEMSQLAAELRRRLEPGA
jgi:histidyl-tRNA synthetase